MITNFSVLFKSLQEPTTDQRRCVRKKRAFYDHGRLLKVFPARLLGKEYFYCATLLETSLFNILPSRHNLYVAKRRLKKSDLPAADPDVG